MGKINLSRLKNCMVRAEKGEELASLIEKLRQIESVLDVERGTPG